MKRFLLLVFFFISFCFGFAQYQNISSEKNVFGFTNSSSTTLTYNKDLNVIALTQRITNTWPDSAFSYMPNPLGKTGYLVTKWSVDNGNTWDSLCYYQNDVHYPRYPSGVIFNPPGNTNVNDAYAVGFGPTFNGTNWDGIYFASTKLNGNLSTKPNMHTPTNNDQQWFALDSLSIGDSIYFSPASSTVTDSAVWICATVVNEDYYPKAIAVIKGTLVDSSFHWEVDTIIKNQWVVNRFGNTYLTKEPKITFHPSNPMIGYILAEGVDSLAPSYRLKSTYAPMVWKTIDGGAHWNRVNQNYDWVATSNDIQLFQNTWSWLSVANSNGYQYPNFVPRLGSDICVDSLGNLNYVAAPLGSYSQHRDSLGFTYNFAYNGSQWCGEPYLMHFTTNGDGTWRKILLDKLNTGDLATNNEENKWVGTPPFRLFYNNRIQISRTSKGNKIIASWIDTDVVDIQGAFSPPYLNLKPSFKSKAYDVVTQKYSNVTSINKSQTPNGGFWWMCASDISMDDTTQQTTPAIFIDQIPSNGYFTGANSINVNFVNDITFTNSNYSLLFSDAFMNINNCVFINGVNEYLLKDITVFPNPVNKTLSVKVDESTLILSVKIYSITGQLVESENPINSSSSMEINIESLSTGIYILELETSYGVKRSKLIKE